MQPGSPICLQLVRSDPRSDTTAGHDIDSNHLRYSTEGKTRHWLERYHFVVSTLDLGLKINFGQPIKWIEFQNMAEIKWLPVNL